MVCFKGLKLLSFDAISKEFFFMFYNPIFKILLSANSIIRSWVLVFEGFKFHGFFYAHKQHYSEDFSQKNLRAFKAKILLSFATDYPNFEVLLSEFKIFVLKFRFIFKRLLNFYKFLEKYVKFFKLRGNIINNLIKIYETRFKV